MSKKLFLVRHAQEINAMQDALGDGWVVMHVAQPMLGRHFCLIVLPSLWKDNFTSPEEAQQWYDNCLICRKAHKDDPLIYLL